jgi:hypothetical protein
MEEVESVGALKAAMSGRLDACSSEIGWSTEPTQAVG